MYLQITERCNMSCLHCCVSATGKGAIMDREVYMAALQLATHRGDYVTIGGGEPTTHPEFMEYVCKAVTLYQRGGIDMAPLVITNGKRSKVAHKLLDMVDSGAPLYVELSRDSFHDPIHPLVVSRFMAAREANKAARYSGRTYPQEGGADIRTVQRIMPVGRAVETGVYTEGVPGEECCCEDLFVTPNGDIYSCGCKTRLIGTVWEHESLDYYSSEYAHSGGFEPAEEELAA